MQVPSISRVAISLYIIFSRFIFALGDSQLSVNLKSCSGDTQTFKVVSAGMNCDNYCTWGSEANFQGTYSIGYYGLENAYPRITASAWGMTVFNGTVDICDNGHVSSSSGSTCPATGSYTFSTHADLPNAPSWVSSFASYISVTLVTDIDFGDDYVQCSFAVSGRNYNNSSAYFISGAILFSGLMAFGIVKRRRRIVTEGDIREKLAPRFQSFETMEQEAGTVIC